VRTATGCPRTSFAGAKEAKAPADARGCRSIGRGAGGGIPIVIYRSMDCCLADAADPVSCCRLCYSSDSTRRKL